MGMIDYKELLQQVCKWPNLLQFEQEIQTNKFNLKSYLKYINYLLLNPIFEDEVKNYKLNLFIYRRCSNVLPHSFKAWKILLEYQLDFIMKYKRQERKDEKLVDEFYVYLLDTFQAAIKHVKYLGMYFKFIRVLLDLKFITKTRQVINEALRNLPLTQHVVFFKSLIRMVYEYEFLPSLFVVNLFRKYEKLVDSRDKTKQEFILHLLNNVKLNDRIIELIFDNDLFTFEVFSRLCDESISDGLSKGTFERVMRYGIQKFKKAEVGKLYNTLAKYYISISEIDTARQVFEEGLEKTMNLRDFVQVYDCFVEFEESYLEALMESNTDQVEIELRMYRLEKLLDRRAFYMNQVLLRQNPHNVIEWLSRVELFKSEIKRTGNFDLIKDITKTFEEALKQIHPLKSDGKVQSVYIQFVKFHENLRNHLIQIKVESNNDAVEDSVSWEELSVPDTALKHCFNHHRLREIFESSLEVNYRHPDNLAECYIEYAEFELRHNNTSDALNILARGVTPTGKRNVHYLDGNLPCQARVFKSVKLWNFYLDLEERVGDLQSVRAAYDGMIELGVCVVQNIVNYAYLLECNNYFEDSYRIYEKGIELFKDCNFEIWNIYLSKIVGRYKGTKLERIRDLFQQSLKSCDKAKERKSLYLMYSKYEEDFGQKKKAIKILLEGSKDLNELGMYEFTIGKCVEYFGLSESRPIYEEGVEKLSKEEALTLGKKFIKFEIQMGEIQRARLVFGYLSELSGAKDEEFWQQWHEFEVEYGDEDSYKEMLRIKRGVENEEGRSVEYLAKEVLRKRRELERQEQMISFTKDE